ncbi:MAG: hypothetical protein D3909_05545 [Candidatus Electrothrix sp. ATG1]|nr:hypothetical protein [Candidatus Electrothrix sp. ATG1]
MFEYLTFIATAVSLAGYLLFAKRKVDIFLVAGFSALLFSAPLFYGVVTGPPGYPDMVIEWEVYLTFILLFTALLISTVINDTSLSTRRLDVEYVTVADLRLGRKIGRTFFIIWLYLLYYILTDFGIQLLYGVSKRTILDSLGAELVLLTYTSIITATCLIVFYGNIGRLLACAILALMLMIGERTPIALSGISVLLILGRKWPKKSLLVQHNKTTPLLLLGSIIFLSLLKPLYSIFKIHGLKSMLNYITFENYVDLISKGAEFISTQYQFNTIVRYMFKTDGMHILRGPLSFIPIPRVWYTTPSSEYNDIFQPSLFPDITYGMAYNPFAEFYAGAGIAGIVMYISIYIFSIFILNQLIKKRRISSAVLFAMIGSLVAFYSYRNSFAVSFGFIRNIFWPYIAVWLFYARFFSAHY